MPVLSTSHVAALLALPLMLGALCACKRDSSSRFRPPPGPKTGISAVHTPSKLTSIETGKKDGLDRPIRISCVTCHSTRDAGAFSTTTAQLREFHVGLVVQHGALECASCHVPRAGGEPRLHLADGTELSTADTMRLCAQCHGPKYQAYLHGGHGGMTGYWDLSQGDRSRNHCVDCHDPHVPKFQPSHPVLPPRDRFLTPQADEPEGRGAATSHG